MKTNITRVIEEIDHFRNCFKVQKTQGWSISQLEEDVYTITSSHHNPTDSRDIDIAFMALTHGDEVGGVQVLNELLRLIMSNWNLGSLKIAFILANAPAACGGVRFLEKDLNREFGNDIQNSAESRRARALEKLFLRTKLLVDYHQTDCFTPYPFFISRFDAKSFVKFRQAMPNISAITYFGKNLTPTSLTTVNYHLKHGGEGFGIELGQRGFSDYQTEFGVSLAIKLIHSLTKNLQVPILDRVDFNNTYTFASTVVTQTGSWVPTEKISNLVPLKPGELIGTLDEADLYVKNEDRIIFLKRPAGGRLAAGAEVFRFIRPVSETEIAARLLELKEATQ